MFGRKTIVTLQQLSRRQNRWRLPSAIAVGGIVLSVALLGWGLFGPRPTIRVARETTFLTTPLAADGLPDYEAALLAMAGPAPPPKDNAAVELLQVMWPLGLEVVDLPLLCNALGIPATPPDHSLVEPTADPAETIAEDVYTRTFSQPWTSVEYPNVAAWLAKHEEGLDRLVAAANRPRFWLPSPSLLDDTTAMLVESKPDGTQPLRAAIRMISCRALRHVGEGRYAEAWRDVRAVHRFSRLLIKPARGPQSIVTNLVAAAIANQAGRMTATHLIGAPDLPADLLERIRRDLDELPPLADAADVVLQERLFIVDAVVSLARQESADSTHRKGVIEEIFGNNDVGRVTNLDWNFVLGRINALYDDFDDALRLPPRVAREAAQHRETYLEHYFATASKGWQAAIRKFLVPWSRTCRSAVVCDMMVATMFSRFSIVVDSVLETRARAVLTRTAAALAAWRADQLPGSARYPERLDNLVPKYLAAEPADPYNDRPLVYERRGEGYLVASVGKNGVYDGGDDLDGWIVGGEWQTTEQDVDYNKTDLVVRMPVPALAPRESSSDVPASLSVKRKPPK